MRALKSVKLFLSTLVMMVLFASLPPALAAGEDEATPASQILFSSAPDTTPAAPLPYFIAIFSLGPAWQKDKPAHEQLYFKEHSANLRKWRDDKKIVLGARYSDKGMIVLSAHNEAEARAWLENDPMVVNKLFNLELYPFTPFYLGCLEKK